MSLTPREIIAAAQDGKKVGVFKKDGQESVWSPIAWGDDVGLIDNSGDGFRLNLRDYTYEIVGEPLEFWVNIYPTDYPNNRYSTGYTTEEQANQSASGNRIRCILVREVPKGEV